VKVVRYKIREY